MGVHIDLVLITELGALDEKIGHVRHLLKVLPEKEEGLKKLAESMALRERESMTQADACMLRRKELELELGVHRSHLRKWETRSNELKGEREYAALMSEISIQKKVISELESKIIDQMQAKEDWDKKIAEASEKRADAEHLAHQEQVRIQEELEAHQTALGELEQARQVLSGKISPSLLKRYDQVALRRKGTGIAFVKREICEGCMRMIPPELSLRVTKGESIEQCPSCQRFLIARPVEVAANHP